MPTPPPDNQDGSFHLVRRASSSGSAKHGQGWNYGGGGVAARFFLLWDASRDKRILQTNVETTVDERCQAH